MIIVLDTNVLVSGLLTPFGVCGEIVRMIPSGDLSLCVDARILSEYRDVLSRSRFKIDPDRVESVLEYIEHGEDFFSPRPLAFSLPDPDDAPFLEVAIASSAECLVTGNLKHFPANRRGGVRILSPSEFLEFFRGKTSSRRR
jgi:uncharacterized protein